MSFACMELHTYGLSSTSKYSWVLLFKKNASATAHINKYIHKHNKCIAVIISNKEYMCTCMYTSYDINACMMNAYQIYIDVWQYNIKVKHQDGWQDMLHCTPRTHPHNHRGVAKIQEIVQAEQGHWRMVPTLGVWREMKS